MSQEEMIILIGKLDRIISEMMVASKKYHQLDEADQQTLKHHAEDMKMAGEAILERIAAK